ncbi:MAG TPA: EAL domain-containing protein [Thermomicrobiales bacterium]|nr:EAL domain-containing protein [Thermomicrobiales bacterium]
MQHQAFHDPLTGLPNRALFLDRLEHALAYARRRRESVAVLFVDLDRFKVINDSLGHEAGDLLLIAVASALKGCLRPEDTAARLGGDEFTILLERVADITAAVEVAERILGALQTPLPLGGYDLVVTGSLGIALSTPERDDPVELMRQADVALYRAKASGKACYQVYDATMNARVLERLELEAELRRALEREEFVVHYQPKVALATGHLEGVEALVRWQHPERGLLPPAAFIALAEETGLIRPLGRWVLIEACRQARAWRAEHPADPPLVMAVNLTAPQFQQPHLAADIATILAETGLPPHLLQLEITESVLMDDAAATLATLGALKRLGVQLAIDDFGTGYSSLSYLKRFPVDWLKVDRRFVAGLGTDAEDTAIVRAVVNLAAALRLAVTAEGVETADQVARLQALGCTLAQGFYFARPLPAAALGALLAGGRDCSPLAGSPAARGAADE